MRNYENEASGSSPVSAFPDQGKIGQCVGGGLNPSYRPGIRERIQIARVNAASAMERQYTAERIALILEKHPEFGELLDLLDQF